MLSCCPFLLPILLCSFSMAFQVALHNVIGSPGYLHLTVDCLAVEGKSMAQVLSSATSLLGFWGLKVGDELWQSEFVLRRITHGTGAPSDIDFGAPSSTTITNMAEEMKSFNIHTRPLVHLYRIESAEKSKRRRLESWLSFFGLTVLQLSL